MSTTHETQWMEREDFGDLTVVRVKTPKVPDEEVIRAVFDPIYTLVTGVGRSRLILNLAAVEYLPSMALGKLVMLNRKVEAANGRLALCHLSATVKGVFESTHLTPVFKTYATEQEALQSFA